jgi:hypothetical protein
MSEWGFSFFFVSERDAARLYGTASGRESRPAPNEGG